MGVNEEDFIDDDPGGDFHDMSEGFDPLPTKDEKYRLSLKREFLKDLMESVTQCIPCGEGNDLKVSLLNLDRYYENQAKDYQKRESQVEDILRISGGTSEDMAEKEEGSGIPVDDRRDSSGQ